MNTCMNTSVVVDASMVIDIDHYHSANQSFLWRCNGSTDKPCSLYWGAGRIYGLGRKWCWGLCELGITWQLGLFILCCFLNLSKHSSNKYSWLGIAENLSKWRFLLYQVMPRHITELYQVSHCFWKLDSRKFETSGVKQWHHFNEIASCSTTSITLSLPWDNHRKMLRLMVDDSYSSRWSIIVNNGYVTCFCRYSTRWFLLVFDGFGAGLVYIWTWMRRTPRYSHSWWINFAPHTLPSSKVTALKRSSKRARNVPQLQIGGTNLWLCDHDE